MKMIFGDWTEMGYIIGITLVLAITIHPSHWVTFVLSLILSYFGYKNDVKGGKDE